MSHRSSTAKPPQILTALNPPVSFALSLSGPARYLSWCSPRSLGDPSGTSMGGFRSPFAQNDSSLVGAEGARVFEQSP
jgi:hypothetical protein